MHNQLEQKTDMNNQFQVRNSIYQKLGSQNINSQRDQQLLLDSQEMEIKKLQMELLAMTAQNQQVQNQQKEQNIYMLQLTSVNKDLTDQVLYLMRELQAIKSETRQQPPLLTNSIQQLQLKNMENERMIMELKESLRKKQEINEFYFAEVERLKRQNSELQLKQQDDALTIQSLRLVQCNDVLGSQIHVDSSSMQQK